MRTDRYKTDSRRKRGLFGKKSLTTVFVIALSVILMVGCVVGTTLAWLTAETTTVVNTFTYGDINITLTENGTSQDNNGNAIKTYKMVPGNTISKDPVVTVEPNSEACWLFVKIVEGGTYAAKDKDGNVTANYHFDDFIEYAIATDWNVLEAASVDSDNDTIVIYRQVAETDGTTTADDLFEILAAGSYSCEEQGNKSYSWNANNVLVKPCVTKDMMELLKQEGITLPSLTFTAYAVQQASFSTAEAAWAEINS